jgi:hypothetical protein
MATLSATTTFSFDKGATTQTVTLSATATAGMTLVCVSAGGAIITAHLNTSGGTAFTKRAQTVNSQEAAVQDAVCSGGETQVVLVLNGAENISGIIYSFPALGAYISSGSNNGAAPGSSADSMLLPTALSVAQNAVLIAGFSTSVAGSGGASAYWYGFGPLGKLYANASHLTGTGIKAYWASGLADITAAGSWPASQSAGNYKAASQWLNGGNSDTYTVAAAYADSSGVPTNPAPVNNTAAENRLPGTPTSNWYIAVGGTYDTTITGYCDKLSYAPGDTVSFQVDSSGNPFHVEIYRLGFYGEESQGARNVLGAGTTTDAGYITGTIVTQSAPSVDSTLGSTSCAWTANATWTIPSNACSGVYHAVFRRTDVITHYAVGVFIVRPSQSSAKGKVAVCLSDFTWHAYNVWGSTADGGGPLGTGTWTGRSLYQIGGDGNAANNAHRAYAVCSDRPYATGSTVSQTFLYDNEQPLISFLEAQGYDLAYYSNIDQENDSSLSLLATAKLVVLIGHQEYWTANVYSSFQAARDAGVNFMIQSSNTALWHTRFAAADTSKRTMICYKDGLTVDVTAGFTGTGRDPAGYTGTWRDSRTAIAPNNPDVRRENALTGQLFVLNGVISTTPAVPFASKGIPIWRNSAGVQALTSGNVYTATHSTAGFETDSADGSAGQPPNLVNLNSFSIGPVGQGANANGTTYSATVTETCGFTLYRAASRGLVFNTGAWRGWWGTTQFAGSGLGASKDVNWQNALLAVMYDLGCPPVTLASMRPGIDTDVTDPATGAPAPSTDKTGVARAYGLRCPEDGQFMAVML